MPRKPCIDERLLARGRRHLLRSDPKLAGVMRRAGACGLRRQGDPYRFLVRCILYQQLAGSAASAIEKRLHAHFGGRVPAPEKLARVRDTTLRRLGLSRQKAAAVRAVARAFSDGTVRARRLPYMSDPEVVETLCTIRGVGHWTAHMVLMSSLGRPDILPVGDYGVRKGAAMLYGLRELPGPRKLEALAEPWRPYRSLASWYLWRVTEVITPG